MLVLEQPLSRSKTQLEFDSNDRLISMNEQAENIDELLMDAAKRGDHENVSRLLNEGTKIKCEDMQGNNVLLWSVFHGHVQVAEALVHGGFDVNHENHQGCTSLMWAAEGGDNAMVELLISKGAKLNTMDDKGWTALAYAVSKNREGAVQILLAHGVVLEAFDIYTPPEEVPLLLAIAGKHNNLVRILFQAYQAVGLEPEYLDAALRYAALTGNSEAVELLLDSGALIDTAEYESKALFIAAEMGRAVVVRTLLSRDGKASSEERKAANALALRFASVHGHACVVQALIEDGVDVDVDLTNGGVHTEGAKTALLHAAEMGRFGVVALLVKHGALLSARDCYQRDALLLAAGSSSESKSLVELLLNSGADLHSQDSTGGNALIRAACRGHLKISALLLDRGIDIHHRNNSGETAISCAVSNGHSTLVQMLISQGADLGYRSAQIGAFLLMIAARMGRNAVIRYLVRGGAAIDDQDSIGSTALMVAVLSHRVSTAELLLDLGANINTRNHAGQTPLVCAIVVGANTNMFRLLLQRGADVDLPDCTGESPLAYAAMASNIKVFGMLLDRGANPNSQNAQGLTPLMKVALGVYDSTFKIVWDHGINLNGRNASGETALMKVAELGSERALRELIRHGAKWNIMTNDGKRALDFCNSNSRNRKRKILLMAELKSIPWVLFMVSY